MRNFYWIKLYYDLLDDRKVGQLPDSLKWRFIECLLLAGEEQNKGILPKINDMAWKLGRMSPEALTNDLAHLARAELVELISTDDGERWLVTAFSKRQKKKSNAERQAAWRSRSSDDIESNDVVTGRYLDKKRIDKIRLDVDTDARETKPRKQKATHTHPVYDIPENLKTEQFETSFVNWFAHKTEQGQPMTQRSGDALLCKLGKMGSVRAVAAIQHSMAANWKSVHEPKEQGDNGRSTSRMIPDESPERKGGLY